MVPSALSADPREIEEMKLRRFTKRTTAVAVFLGFLLSAGIAFAAWVASGSGSGTASAITPQTVTVTAHTGTADLFPGADGKVFFTLTNANPYSITYTSATVGTITSGDTGNCASSNVTGNTGLTGLTLQVGASTTSGTLSIPAAVHMAHAAPNGCEGVAFTVALTLTGSQD